SARKAISDRAGKAIVPSRRGIDGIGMGGVPAPIGATELGSVSRGGRGPHGGTDLVARRRREMPRGLIGPSVLAWTLRFSVLGMAVAAVEPAGAHAAQAPGAAAEVPLIYAKRRNFRIPFNLSAAERSRIKEVLLLVSEDSGYTWRPVSRTFPDH